MTLIKNLLETPFYDGGVKSDIATSASGL